jgi:hypothetical protein
LGLGGPNQGALGKKNERPRQSAEPIQKAPTHLIFFFPTCFFLAFPGVSQQVEFKNTKILLLKNFLKKIDVENVLQNNEKISISFFPGRERAAERLDFFRSDLSYRNGIHGSH